ncbi:MAG: sodium-independent anion transporter [Deltaproteobacteria bacterium]|nr:MAG: sodium-independent anion transporter [Deltaproteobacteria bacterium]
MLTKVFPFLLWFQDYDTGKLRTDIVAGITVAMVLIPQSMAYAQLAGLPAYYGLYAAFLPPMVAALFGSSRQLATGPVAVVSLMSAASLEPLATAGSAEFIAYSVLLALTVGIFQFLLGVLRLGLVVNLLSHPVVNGFTNAAAIIIASSQFSKLFGVYVDKAPHHYQTIINVCKSAIHYTHVPTLAMGIFSIALMTGLKRVNPRIPNVLVAVAITTVISFAFHFNNDNYVPISHIKAPNVTQMITSFNADVAQIKTLGAERAKLNTTLKPLKDAVGHHPPSMEILDLEHKLAIINMRIDTLKASSGKTREAIRSIHFSLPKDAGDAPLYYLAGQEPSGTETDGRTWRLKVGNKPLDTANLKMIGAGAIIGDIPKGLKVGVPILPPNTTFVPVFLQLLPYAVIISLLGFMEAIAIAKAMAAKTGQKLDPNQELIGQGMANIIGSFGFSYAISGSFSRSAVNLQANAVSGISSVVTSLMVALTLLFFTPLLYHLPQAVLASVIMMAVIGLVNVSGFIHAWKAKRSDGAISVITFICTLYFAPHLEEGIMVGVALTFMVFIYKNLRPRVALLSRSQDETFRSSVKYGLKQCDHIAAVRFDGSLIFTNASYLEDKVLEYINKKPDLRNILIESSGINDLDASGEEALSILVESVRDTGRGIFFSAVKEEVMAVFERTHLIDKIGRENIFATGEQALTAIYNQTQQSGHCAHCPMAQYMPLESPIQK